MNPSAYPIGTAYGVPGRHWAAGHHTGVDYLSPAGGLVVAPADSKILHAGTDGGWGPAYGVHVIGETTVRGKTLRWITAHLSSIADHLAPGTRVMQGTPIGQSGQSGNVTGPHLHFEVREAPFTYGSDIPPGVLTEITLRPAAPPQTKVIDHAVDDLAKAIAARKPGPVRKALREARQKVIAARRKAKGLS